MKNYLAEGKILRLTAPSGGVVSGNGYLIGSLFVVAAVTAAETLAFDGYVEGVFTLPKEASASDNALVEGQKVYWDAGNARVTDDAIDGALIGVAAAAAASTATTVAVRLNGTSPDLAEGPQAAIADLVAITGGEAPTEAEHNLVVTKVNAILAALRAGGIIASS